VTEGRCRCSPKGDVLSLKNAERFGPRSFISFGDELAAESTKAYCILLTSAKAKEVRKNLPFRKASDRLQREEAEGNCRAGICCLGRPERTAALQVGNLKERAHELRARAAAVSMLERDPVWNA